MHLVAAVDCARFVVLCFWPYLLKPTSSLFSFSSSISTRAISLNLRTLCVCVRFKQFKPTKVDEVVLVGGVSRTPCIRALLRTFFPHVPDLCTSCDADTSVAEGLAIRGKVCEYLCGDDE
jgi:hypothetical protein